MTEHESIEFIIRNQFVVIKNLQAEAIKERDLEALCELEDQERELVVMGSCFTLCHDTEIQRVLDANPNVREYVRLLWERIDVLGDYDYRAK